MKRPARLMAVAAVMLLLAACGRPTGTTAVPPVAMPSRDVGTIIDKLRTLTDEANTQTLANTAALTSAVTAFLKTPNEQTRATMQHAWLDAHKSFAATRALMIGNHADLLFRIDAWPIEPGFLDSLPQYPESGIVNDFTLTISKQTLEAQNGITDAEEVCLGFHPLEYYAFDRAIADFVPAGAKTLRARIIDRRRHVLSLIAILLNDAVKQLAGQMKADLAKFTPRSDTDRSSDDRLVRRIIEGSKQLAKEQYREANLIVGSDEGHARFSHSSLASLAGEIRAERDLYASKGDLMAILRGLDPKTAANLDTTLSDADKALGNGAISKAERTKVPLMFQALGHQFDDLAHHLPADAP